MPDYVYWGTGRTLKPHEVKAVLTGTPGTERRPRPDLATSREARAAVPAPTLIQGAVLRDAPAIEPPPVVEGRPPAPELSPEWRERMASVLEPARCGRCGYRLAKCDCAARFGDG
jgi:hypothetical protein